MAQLSSVCRWAIGQTWNLSSFFLALVLLQSSAGVHWTYAIAWSLITAVALGLAYNGQDLLMYYPDQPASSRLFVDMPSGLPYESMHILTTDGIKIHAVFIKQPPNRVDIATTLVYFHGNAGNIGHRIPNASLLSMYCGCNVFLVEYRGYGKSGGLVQEQGLYLDAEAAVDYLLSRSDIDTSKIILFGRSLGGSVAIRTALVPRFKKQLFALVLENTFTSLPDIGRVVINVAIIKLVPRWFYKNQYPSDQRIKDVDIPTLFLSGLSDQLVPPAMMDKLHADCGSVYKRLARFEGGTHNETWQCSGYYDVINRFLAETYQAPRRTSSDTCEH